MTATKIKSPVDLIPTRNSLINRLKDLDDTESWLDFFNTYWRLIFSVAVEFGLTEVEAEEVVQETIISVARNIGKFRHLEGRGSFKGWLLKMTRWRIKDQLRKRRHQNPLPGKSDTTRGTPLLERFPDPNGELLDVLWEREWERNLIETAMNHVKDRVDPKHFQIFHFYAVKQLPVHEVSRLFKVNIGQVYLIKCRILSMVKKEVKRLESLGD